MFFGPHVDSISTEEASSRLKSNSVVLIDCREPYEFAAGHVPGAVNLPLGSLPAAASKYGSEKEILVICQSGSRSVSGCKRLLKAGFRNVTNVRGGTGSWRGKLVR